MEDSIRGYSLYSSDLKKRSKSAEKSKEIQVFLIFAAVFSFFEQRQACLELALKMSKPIYFQISIQTTLSR